MYGDVTILIFIKKVKRLLYDFHKLDRTPFSLLGYRAPIKLMCLPFDLAVLCTKKAFHEFGEA